MFLSKTLYSLLITKYCFNIGNIPIWHLVSKGLKFLLSQPNMSFLPCFLENSSQKMFLCMPLDNSEKII